MTLLSLGGWASPPPKVVDRAVASIEGRVVTLSQLEFEARVMLVASGGVAAAFAPLDDAALRAALQQSIDERLALLEADKLGAYLIESAELEQAVSSFRNRFATEAQFRQFLATHDAELPDVVQVLSRSLRAQRALEGKLRLRAQVSEGEARAHVAAHPELQKLPLENVRSALIQQRFAQLVKRELAEQRSQVDVRLLGPFAPSVVAP